MATDRAEGHQELLTSLDASDWSVVLQAISVAEKIIQRALVGDRRGDEIVSRLVGLASHPKWEVRRAVANAAAHVSHSAFESVLAKLALDQNTRVRQAAEQASLRRRDSRHASTLGKQHEERINSTLDDIEARFGSKGRDAVKRAAEQIANTFARELYHEVIKLLSPIATSAERLRTHLSATNVSSQTLAEEAERIGRRVAQLRSVLDAMRAYTAQPVLSFQGEVLREVIHEAASVALEGEAERSRRPEIEINVPADMIVDLARARFVQALTNIVANAVESYREMDVLKPIEISAEVQDGLVAISIEDSGCGMSAENQRDALTLFATSKPNGTGFGLPLAVKIVESEHRGRLNVDSLKGRGTIVNITIPTHHQPDRL
jgi:nitrogen fixation/metabolism regulation signal transduction histidine kinase